MQYRQLRESMGIVENNLLKAIKAIESQQRVTRGPTCWQAYEEEIIELRKKLGELKHGK
jgi:hypothetical protein